MTGLAAIVVPTCIIFQGALPNGVFTTVQMGDTYVDQSDERTRLYNYSSPINTTFKMFSVEDSSTDISTNKVLNLFFSEVLGDDGSISLSKPYIINYSKDDEYFIAEDHNINLYCWGRSVDVLKDDVNENLYALFENYVNCDESELTQDAIELRNKLKEYFS